MAENLLTEQLCNASAAGNFAEVRLLLENGAEVNRVNKYRRTALQAAKLCRSDLIEALVSAGADPNLRDPACGLTVLHDAAREGFADTVRVLLQHGADPNLAGDRGHLPLHLAAREGRLEVVRLLLGCTADPGATDAQGYTAARLALERGWTDTVAYLEQSPQRVGVGQTLPAAVHTDEDALGVFVSVHGAPP